MEILEEISLRCLKNHNKSRNTMRQVIFLFSFLLLSLPSFAQQIPTLTISAEGSVELPADIIRFDINLNAEADAPQEAYNLHKEREDLLVQLLNQYDIQEEYIRFEPISISKTNTSPRYSEQETRYQTRQAVSLKLTDFRIYEELQVALIEAEFDNFSGSFSSSQLEEGRDQALKNAIETAKEKASLIAGESGLKLGDISSINYSHGQDRPVYSRSSDLMMLESSGGQLMEFDQVVTVRTNITMEFAIE